jgi:hypothetical protein
MQLLCAQKRFVLYCQAKLKAFHWMNEDPANDTYTEKQLKDFFF